MRRLVPATALLAAVTLAGCSTSSSLSSSSVNPTVPGLPTVPAPVTGATLPSVTIPVAPPPQPKPPKNSQPPNSTTTTTTAPTTPGTTVDAVPFTKIPNEINLKNAAEPTGLSDADLDCVNDPGMPGWSMASCQRDGNLAGLTFTRNDDGRLGAGIFLLNGPTWTRTHFVEEEAPGTWSQITVRVGSFGGSSSPTAFFGYRYAGTGGFLDVDIVRLRTNGELRFQGLRSLDKGAVAIPPGNDPGLVVTAQPGPADPNCCPSAFLVRGLRLNNGVWEISDGTTVPAADAPTGPFDL